MGLPARWRFGVIVAVVVLVAAGGLALALNRAVGVEGAAVARAPSDAGTPAPGSAVPSVPAPVSSPSGGASPTAAAVSAPPTNGSSLAPNGPSQPSGVFDLTNWKLTLPVTTGGSSKPQEILQPGLARFAMRPYFMVNAARTGVVFQANAGGATTSNSGYPRSELREMAAGGATEASWSTTSGTSTMTERLAITQLTAAKPQVTVGQVHDGSDDVLVVRLDGPHHLYAEHNGRNYGDLDTNYVLGTVFTVAMVASGGHIKIYYNGAQKVDYPIKSSGDYFKAGCYLQSNTSKGDAADAYAQVVIYGLRVTHA
jgi:hypothetical protein